MKRKTAFNLTSPLAKQGEALAVQKEPLVATPPGLTQPKAKEKRTLPKGAIWWLSQPCHPVILALGRVVRRERKDRGWSLRDLSEVTDLSISTLSEVENGRVSTKVEIILRLEAAFEMKRGDLMDLAHKELSADG